MHFAILGFLIVLVIAYFVVVWKAAPHWRWYQLVAVSITLLLAVIFLFPVAGVLRSRSAWHQVKEELEARLVQEQVRNKELKYGDPTNPSVGEGVRALSQTMSQLGIEAGRRWRNLRLQNASDQGIVLVQPPPETVPGMEPPPEPAASTQPLVPQGMVVYGFAERPAPGVEVPIPQSFLGEFQVTASTPNQVTLSPTGRLERGPQQAIANREATFWSLYELLPLDGHRPFIAEGSEPTEENIFGRVDEDLVRRLLERQVQNPALQSVLDATLEKYLRDGSRASDDDPPETRWVMVEFTERHTIPVDSPDDQGALDGGYFDGSGRAVDGRLKRGNEGEVTFNTGDRIVVKKEAADPLTIEQDVADEIDSFFVRPLNDYRFALRRIGLMLDALANRKTELEFENQVLTEAKDKTIALIQGAQEVRDNLEQDLAQFQVEQRAISSYRDNLQERVTETRETLLRLYRSNRDLEAELRRIHLSIQQRVDALTASVD